MSDQEYKELFPRLFDVVFLHKKKRVGYKDLSGQQALRLMRKLKQFNPVAITSGAGTCEELTLEQMEELIIQ